MGNLVTIVGNTAAGKTRLVETLHAAHPLAIGIETHLERPFQALFKMDACFGFANQVDYFLMRAEQEKMIRSGNRTGILDGGMEMDFHIFSRLFHARGLLRDDEFALLERLYRQLRDCLPAPELVIHLSAPIEILEQRYKKRNRSVEIASTQDFALIETLLAAWLTTLPAARVAHYHVSNENLAFTNILPDILTRIKHLEENHEQKTI